MDTTTNLCQNNNKIVALNTFFNNINKLITFNCLHMGSRNLLENQYVYNRTTFYGPHM